MSSPAQESLLTSYWLVRSRTYDRPVASFQSQTSRSLGQLRLRGGLLALSCLAATLGLWGLFVFTHTGQTLDAMALEGSEIGSHYVSAHARTLLSVVSMPAAVVLVVTILVIGLLRRSHRRAVWAVVAGAPGAPAVGPPRTRPPRFGRLSRRTPGTESPYRPINSAAGEQEDDPFSDVQARES